MKKIIPMIAMAMLLLACQEGGGSDTQVSVSSNPFLGGTQGLEFDFQDFREEVFDDNTDPFNLVVRLENKGEALVERDDVRVKLSGFNPAEFGKTQQQLEKQSPEDVIERRKDPQGNVLPGPQVFVEFNELNYEDRIVGATAEFPIRADVCYLYRTRAVSKLCIRENLLTPRPGGICEINEQKQVYSSGAPVQIRNFKESTRSRDKVGFTFEVANVGVGDLYKRNTECAEDESESQKRAFENKAYVVVTTNLEGLQCTGLDSTSAGAEGEVTLFGDAKLVSCTQQASGQSDFEQLVNIEVIYDYEERTQTTLKVKSAGSI